MVSKEIITNIIEKSYIAIKCKVNRIGNNSLSNQIKHTLNNFAEKTKNNKIEQGLIIGNNGQELEWSDGTYENVGYDEDTVKKALDNNDGKDLHFEHNHVGSFIDKEKKFDEMIQLNMPTMLSLPDVDTLFEHMNYNGQEVIPFKSITADSTNGTRMTLTRIDKDGEDLTNNHVLKNISDSKYDVHEAWKNMYSRWATFFNQYNNNLKVFNANWMNGERYQQSMREWNESSQTEEDRKRIFQDGFWRAYYRERDKFAKQMVKENFEEDVMKDSVKEFEKVGFELSLEWRGEYK